MSDRKNKKAFVTLVLFLLLALFSVLLQNKTAR